MRDADGSIVHPWRGLPSIQRLLEHPQARAVSDQFSRPALVAALRRVLEEIRAGRAHTDDSGLLARAGAMLAAAAQPHVRRVVNATGIALHTNLGRAPLAPEALAAMLDAGGYTNLEFDLDAGGRGARGEAAERLLCQVTGADAALCVNNGAAAILLALAGLAEGGEVIVSRGELVEIGGGFRIPDVIRHGGARLVEVGTTNRTRLADYAAAVTPATRVLLKVHQSNYRVIGFTSAVGVAELAKLARERGLHLVEDLGSGTLADLRALGCPHEPSVAECIGEGADLVTFSGDKLLGGPQAGLLAGRRDAVETLRRHPLLRALRLDKMTLAALEATLRLYAAGAARRIPILRILAQTQAQIEARAGRLQGLLGACARVERSTGYAGGGSLPDEVMASCAVVIATDRVSPDRLARRLRLHRPAIVGRVQAGCVMFDCLAVDDADLPLIAEAVREALA